MAFPELLTKVANKADTYNPIFTGTPQAPTAADGTNTTQIATTEFVTSAVSNKTNVSGNAATATKLATARDITLTSGVTGSASFDGSKNITITATVVKDGHTHTTSTIDGLDTALASKAPIASPELTGIPTAPTANATTNTTQIATTAFVKTAVTSVLDSLVGGLIFKGTLGVGGDSTTLPSANYKAGWTYTVLVAGTYAGQVCESGDMVICTKDYASAYNDDDFTVIQKNIDGVVTGPVSAVVNRVATFSNANGKVIKDSGFTIDTSVPAGAKFTDTVYSHPNSGVTSGTYKSVTVNAQGHVTGGTNPTTLSGYGITDAVAVEAGKGLSTNDFTTDEKTKLAGIATGANNYSLPTASTSTLGGVKVDGTTVTISSGVISSPAQTTITGNAGTATKLATARTIALSGAVTGSVSFDGSADVTITTTSGITSTTASITTTWTGSAAPYTQTISVTGVTTTSVVEVALPSSATEAQVKAYQALNWTDGGQAANSITLKAWGDKNTIAIPINVIIHP